MSTPDEFTLKLPRGWVEAILTLINNHPPAPLTAATEMFNSIQMQVAEQSKAADAPAPVKKK